MSGKQWNLIGFALFTCGLGTTSTMLPDVRQLTGQADYRYVALNWEYDLKAPQLYGFQVHYCELQAWGPHRCKVKNFEDEALVQARQKKSRLYSVIVPGLRMSTNYSFEVRPIANQRNDRELHDPKKSKVVIVSTKGFSAKATLCLPKESEIEVATGPYFGGRIGVEAKDGERCMIEGDSTNPRDTYNLRINHETCGSFVNDTTVSTFVLVQENLPILTHSTRRFLVLCTVQPDTLTVRAKLNLPHRDGNRLDDNEESQSSINSADLDLQESLRRDARMLKYQQPTPATSRSLKGEPVAQFVLMMTLTLAGAIGFATLIWYTLRRRTRNWSPKTEDAISTISLESSTESEPSEINFEIESVCGICEHARTEAVQKYV